MKITKILRIAAVAALSLAAFASSASATTLETNGVTQSGAVTIHATSAGSLVWSATGGGFANTCTESTIHLVTSSFTGTTVGGGVDSWTFQGCTQEPLTFDTAGTITIEAISGTTNGTVRSTGTKLTEPSPFGTITCTTSNTDIGTLTGTATGTSVIHINAVLNCGFFLPSAKWEGTYNITGHSIGVVA